jgi:ferredoxin-thioredoxin reductase catalytic subunit
MNKTKCVEEIVAGFEHKIQKLNDEISKISNGELLNPTSGGFDNLELTMQGLTRELCDLIAAKQLQVALDKDEVRNESAQLIKAFPQKMKNYGSRLTPVRMSNGTKVEVLTPYFARPCHEKKIEESDCTLLSSSSIFSTLAVAD